MAKINISVPDDQLSRVREFCAKGGLSISAFFRVAAASYIRADELAPKISSVLSKVESVWEKQRSGLSVDQSELDELTAANAELDAEQVRFFK